jgi:hypothetical protein
MELNENLTRELNRNRLRNNEKETNILNVSERM